MSLNKIVWICVSNCFKNLFQIFFKSACFEGHTFFTFNNYKVAMLSESYLQESNIDNTSYRLQKYGRTLIIEKLLF